MKEINEMATGKAADTIKQIKESKLNFTFDTKSLWLLHKIVQDTGESTEKIGPYTRRRLAKKLKLDLTYRTSEARVAEDLKEYHDCVLKRAQIVL